MYTTPICVFGRRQDRDRFRDAESDAYHEYMHGRKSGAASAGPLVLHKGGCHCGSMTFEVEAPAHLAAVEGASKLRYPFITVPGKHAIFQMQACNSIALSSAICAYSSIDSMCFVAVMYSALFAR